MMSCIENLAKGCQHCRMFIHETNGCKRYGEIHLDCNWRVHC
jgi:hypothetical protein